jgi:hypothetical protein
MSSSINPAPFHKVDMSKHSSDRHIDDFLQMVVNYSSAKLEVIAQEELYHAPGRDITPIIDTVNELVNLIETCKLSIETPFCTGFIPAWVLVDMLRFECLQPKKNTTVMRYIISLIKECK